ncbi:hypothetical protein P154DRAFT_194116 [Amniculicola lignicola CBS 123094]|uniref:PARP catalytic domain-containing protein n=1 Tax=Amniculicola lignicola CBS 123094 TaxID=1392246 RepID=A0A6A5WIJ7_9PLEO|nr:hypothetical protein P154DRAFT_194116 [Amniculicola lignicola CBS 123094]
MASPISLPSRTKRRPWHARHDSGHSTDSLSSTESGTRDVIPMFMIPDSGAPSRLSRKLPWKNDRGNSFHQLLRSTCKANCSIILPRVKSSSGLELITTDPAVVELLLTCVRVVRSSPKRKRRFGPLKLLKDCPIPTIMLCRIIDSLPPLSTITFDYTPSSSTSTSTISETPTNPTSTPWSPLALASTHSPRAFTDLPRLQRSLLTYLLTSPFSHLTTITPSRYSDIHFPTLAALNVTMFLVTRQPPHKESLFAEHCRTQPPIPVFHGTHASRLPSILTHGLKNMSNTSYQTHGRSLGEGIYVADEMSTTVSYCGICPKLWKHGVCQARRQRSDGKGGTYEDGVKIVLGCEAAGEGISKGKGMGIHVVPDETKVVVRFVFMVPEGMGWVGGEVKAELALALEVLRQRRGWGR